MENTNLPKFAVGDLLPIGMSIVVLAIGLAFGMNILSDVKTDFTVSSVEYNATAQGITAIAKIPAKLGIIVTVIIAAVLIGILTRYLMVRYG